MLSVSYTFIDITKLRIITEQGVGNVVKKYPFTKLYIPTNTYIE